MPNRRMLMHVILIAAVTTGVALGSTALLDRTEAEAAVTLPPLQAGFDYQIGGPYAPPAGVQIVSRDQKVDPAPGLYNICYVNAFQVQPGEQAQWDADLLLRDADGNLVIDEDWNEPLLDLRTADQRSRIATKVNGWIDGCADKGYQAIEPDNYDSYLRSKGLLTPDQAKDFLKLLATHSHTRNLAIAQKNTAELAGDRQAVGLDFAVVEECGDFDGGAECGVYADAFDNHVVAVEYTDAGLQNACRGYAGRLSIVQRDRPVSIPGTAGYLRKTC